MSLIPFPNVPALPGVPQLARASQAALTAIGPALSGAAAVGALWRALFVTPQWGIYKQVPPPSAPDADGLVTVTVKGNLTPVVTPDSVLEFGYRNEFDVSDYPIQDGAFASYNKVANPFETSVRLSKGGSQADRQQFLAQIEQIMGTLDMYYILTPEKTYNNINPYRYELTRRGANGAYFLTEVDLYFREIRTVTAQYTQTSTVTTNAQQASAQPVQNTGTVNGGTSTPNTLTGVVNQ
jgi:hypothetical protein